MRNAEWKRSCPRPSFLRLKLFGRPAHDGQFEFFNFQFPFSHVLKSTTSPTERPCLAGRAFLPRSPFRNPQSAFPMTSPRVPIIDSRSARTSPEALPFHGPQSALRAPQSAVPLRLSLSARTVLVTIDTLRAVQGVDAEAIWAGVDEGRWHWVFDVAAHRRRNLRELRFWARELIAPADCARLTIDEALAGILGTGRNYLRGSEVAQLLLVCRPTVFRLWQEGELRGAVAHRILKITRASLARFLQRRLLRVEGRATDAEAEET